MADSYPGLPDPDFLSSGIKSYIDEISQQVGLRFVFAANPKSIAEAEIIVYPDLPVAVIVVDIKKINSAKYNPNIHDPTIAHEATHVQLNSEGWFKLEFDENTDSMTIAKVSTVENWLSDPIVNGRILRKGFDMSPNRIAEVNSSISALQQRRWSKYVKAEGYFGELFATRLFVSFMLEQGVPSSVKRTFRDEFQKDLPHLVEKSEGLLDLIEVNGFDTSDKYRHTAMLCLERLDVNVSTIRFATIPRYSIEEQSKWFEENNVRPDIGWDGLPFPASVS